MDYQSEKTNFYNMALEAGERGEDFKPFLIKHLEMELRHYQQSGVVSKVQILTAGKKNSCKACQSHANEIYTIEDALRLMPLPCNDCNKVMFGKAGFCRCSYNAIVE